jgi:hypothetical protein
MFLESKHMTGFAQGYDQKPASRDIGRNMIRTNITCHERSSEAFMYHSVSISPIMVPRTGDNVAISRTFIDG